MDKNIVLLIGAQGAVEPVEGAINELFEIESLFSKEEKGKLFQIKRESAITKSILESTLSKFRNDIRILHFAGHSSNDTIGLHDGEIPVKTIINYIKNWDFKPSLVFINGCNSAGQVQNLLSVGVSCVIATRIRINDDNARKFAVNFYRELLNNQQNLSYKMAFEDGGAFLKDKNKEKPRTLDIKKVGIINEKPTDWDWGIFSKKNEHEKIKIQSITRRKKYFIRPKNITSFYRRIMYIIIFLFSWYVYYSPTGSTVKVQYSNEEANYKDSITTLLPEKENKDFSKIEFEEAYETDRFGDPQKISLTFKEYRLSGRFKIIYYTNVLDKETYCRSYLVYKYSVLSFINEHINHKGFFNNVEC